MEFKTEIYQLNKLIERKRDYLPRANSDLQKSALKAEINTLKNIVDSLQTKSEEIKEQANIFDKLQEPLKDENTRLLTICKMYGIDLQKWYFLSTSFIKNELARDQQDGIIRAPEQIISLLNKF